MVTEMNRRTFIKKAGVAGAGLGVTTMAGRRAFGKACPNDKVVMAVVGIHGRGRNHIRAFSGNKDSEVKYVVDVDSRFFDKALEEAKDKQEKVPETLKDFRKALDDKDIDAISIATPDHWHAPMTIEALKAGKHVYVEKPCGHNPAEGEMLVDAQKKYSHLLVQMGNQRRSKEACYKMLNEINNGVIGRVYAAKAWYVNNRGPIGLAKQIPVPDSLDWDLWQGPAPRRPYNNLVHPYKWHWLWHWGTGEALNNGTHEVDVARWMLGVDFPTKVVSGGGRLHYANQDDWEAFDTQWMTLEFPGDKVITWEGRSCNKVNKYGHGRGVMFYGTDGAIEYLGGNYIVYDDQGEVLSKEGRESKTDSTNIFDPGLGSGHQDNFVQAVRGEAKLTSPIDEGHKSVLLCQLGNIAQRTGSTLVCDPKNGHIFGNPAAQKLWSRSYEPGWEPKI